MSDCVSEPANSTVSTGDSAVATPPTSSGSSGGTTVTIVLKPDDLESLVLWLDGMAKFIDITKAHLPDLYDGQVILMQRLSRHTVELKKRLQDTRIAAP